MRLLIVLILLGLMHATRSFTSGDAGTPAATSLGLGFVLLSAFFAGGVFKRFGLPRLTGYIAIGITAGPYVLGLLTPSMVTSLKLFNGVAIALIALTAGLEIELQRMRPLLRSIGYITLTAVVGTVILLAITVYLARDLLPFMVDMTTLQTVAVAGVLGAVMAAQSPAVVVALRDEAESDGPLTQTVLGVVVLADLVVILLFAVLSTLAKSTFGGGAGTDDGTSDVWLTIGNLAWEILGSMVVGVLVGVLFQLYVSFIAEGGALFILTVSFAVAEVGQRLALDPLLVALAAGMYVRNVTTGGDRVQKLIEATALPVYVVFFAVTGAGIHLDVLPLVGLPAGIFVATRAFGLLVGTRIGARLAKAPDVVERYAGFGLLPQAGLALALALLFSRTFPEFGSAASALVLGIVAINEIVAPVLYRVALVKSGEAGKGKRSASRIPDTVESTPAVQTVVVAPSEA